MPNVVQEQPLLSPRLQVAESRAFIPVDTSSVSPTAREEQRSDKTGESDDAPSTDQEAFVKSDVEEEEVDETMESVSVTVTEYSVPFRKEEEERTEGDEEENDTASVRHLCLRSLYLKKVNNLTCIQLFVQVTSTHASTAWQPTIVSFVHRSCTVQSCNKRKLSIDIFILYKRCVQCSHYSTYSTSTLLLLISILVYYHQLLPVNRPSTITKEEEQ